LASLVIKLWKVGKSPVDDRGSLIRIEGRRAGILGFILALLKIDPVTRMFLSSERLEFSEASFSGIHHRVIPLQNICSTYYGYIKPWRSALLIGFGVFVAGCGGVLPLIVESKGPAYSLIVAGWVALISIIVSILYYALNLRLTLGFVEQSGYVSVISFKRSVIENIDIDEFQARQANITAQRCIEAKLKHLQAP
jgi:hypothetical protein